jgi:transposase InsO family protein
LFEPLGVTRSVTRKGHPEDNVFVERLHRTNDEEFYIPYLLTAKNEEDLIKRDIWWQKIYNLTLYEKLKSPPLCDTRGDMPFSSLNFRFSLLSGIVSN